MNIRVVGVRAGLANLLSSGSEGVAPGEVGSGVVGAVEVVVVDDEALVVAGLGARSRGSGSRAGGGLVGRGGSLVAGRDLVSSRGRGGRLGRGVGRRGVGRSLLLDRRSGLGPGGGPGGSPGVALGLPVAVEVLLGSGGGGRDDNLGGGGRDVTGGDGHVLGGVDDVGFVDNVTLHERHGDGAGGESGSNNGGAHCDCRLVDWLGGK